MKATLSTKSRKVGRILEDLSVPLVVIGLGVFGLRPFGIGSDYWSSVLVMAGIYTILVVGLNVVVGYAGLLDLGYAGFWAVGAYTTAYITGAARLAPFDLSVWWAIPAAVAATVITGLLLGLVTLRVRGDYLAIVTLGFGEIVRIISNSWDAITNGPSGINNIPHPMLLGFDFGLDLRPYVAFIWAIIGLETLLVSNLWNSRIGRSWYATRQDEDAAEVIGVPTFRMKMLAFAIGASTAGFAGVVYSSYVGFIAPANFVLLVAILLLAAIVLGGMGNLKGVVLGAFAVVILPEVFRGFEQGRYLAFGAVLVVMMILRPSGLMPLRARLHPLPVSPGRKRVPTRELVTHRSRDRKHSPKPATPELRTGTVLQCAGVTLSFGALRAVNKVDLHIAPLTIHGIIGPNGAGKTTLFNLINGILSPDEGEILFRGCRIDGLVPHNVAAMGISRTFQLIRLFPLVTVTENVLIGTDKGHRSSFVDAMMRLPRQRLEERDALGKVAEVLDFCDLRGHSDELATNLSYGDQRRVEIARAMASSPALLLLDEPAAGMNPPEKRKLVDLIRRIRDTGTTVAIIEHDMSVVMDVSDRVTVLDHGMVIAEGAPSEVRDNPAVIEAYLGTVEDRLESSSKPILNLVGSKGATAPIASPVKPQSMLSVRGLRIRYGLVEAVHGIDIDVAEGEIVSVIGANGAGKTSTLLAISGVHRAAAGTIRYCGEEISRQPSHRIAAMGIAHVPEGRRVFQRLTVWENLAMGTFAKRTTPSEGDLERVFALFPVLKDRLHDLGGTLSGGEQQMLALGRALVSGPRLLLMDEPSMGLAPNLVAKIFDLIQEINRQGVSILLVEQNARKALQIADRAYVLETGAVRMQGTSAAMLEHPEIRAAYLGG